MPPNRLLILTNPDKPGVAEQVDALRPWFEQRAETAAELPARDAESSRLPDADLCVVFGGDGTLLTAARALAGTGVPLVGVNMGKLGFLAKFDVEHMRKHFDAILSGEIQPVERMMLDVSVSDCREHKLKGPAANDIAICAGPPFRMVDLDVVQGGAPITRYLGDGLVVATPSGSTGYSMSAGGPIVDPSLDAMTLTPIAPHTLSVRPIVVRSDDPIRITATRVNPGTAVIIDGQVCGALRDGDVIEVRRAERGAMIVPHPGRPFFQTLAEKLHWGLSPHHRT